MRIKLWAVRIGTAAFILFIVPFVFVVIALSKAEYDRFRYTPDELHRQLLDSEAKLNVDREELYCVDQADKAKRQFEDQAESQGFSLWNSAVSTRAKAFQSEIREDCRAKLGLK